mgnify:CR=1 FL=1
MKMESCSIAAHVIPGGDIGADFASCKPASGEVALWWLGQAGFMFKSRSVSWIIDPYLSDYLAHKYRGTRFPHTRLQAPPIAPGNLPPLDYYFCTHGHSDHMDPWTIQPIANRRTRPRFVVPAAERDTAISRGIPREALIAVNAPGRIQLSTALTVDILPAAHEDIEIDDTGHHRFLGYVFDVAGIRLYHSGDSVPFDGLGSLLRERRPHVAFLPTNGRDDNRRVQGIPGNFTVDEAIALCSDAEIPWLIPHHIEMFGFNTERRETVIRHLTEGDRRWILPELGVRYTVGAPES